MFQVKVAGYKQKRRQRERAAKDKSKWPAYKLVDRHFGGLILFGNVGDRRAGTGTRFGPLSVCLTLFIPTMHGVGGGGGAGPEEEKRVCASVTIELNF